MMIAHMQRRLVLGVFLGLVACGGDGGGGAVDGAPIADTGPTPDSSPIPDRATTPDGAPIPDGAPGTDAAPPPLPTLACDPATTTGSALCACMADIVCDQIYYCLPATE